MTEKKNFFWDIFKEDWQREEFYENLVEYNEYVDLLSFKSYISDITKYPYKTQEKNLEFLRKQTLSFLYPLLKNGELVMQSFELDLGNKLKNGECEIKYMYIGNKETADKAIKILEDSWIKCNSQISKNLLEMETWFVLPENIHILEWQREEIWKYIEPIDEIGFRYKEKSKDKKN